jgi:DNA-binding transcriptional ArsR family regulator
MMQRALEALAHPGRRKILQLVMDRELQAGELAELTGMAQPAASQHLRVLREAGLVDVRPVGSRRLYRVNFAQVQAVRAQLDEFWGNRLAALRRATERKR